MRLHTEDRSAVQRVEAALDAESGIYLLLWALSFLMLAAALAWALWGSEPPAAYARFDALARLWPLWACWLGALCWYGAQIASERREIIRAQATLDLDDQRALNGAVQARMSRPQAVN
jgi:hypothetical protein